MNYFAGVVLTWLIFLQKYDAYTLEIATKYVKPPQPTCGQKAENFPFYDDVGLNCYKYYACDKDYFFSHYNLHEKTCTNGTGFSLFSLTCEAGVNPATCTLNPTTTTTITPKTTTTITPKTTTTTKKPPIVSTTVAPTTPSVKPTFSTSTTTKSTTTSPTTTVRRETSSSSQPTTGTISTGLTQSPTVRSTTDSTSLTSSTNPSVLTESTVTSSITSSSTSSKETSTSSLQPTTQSSSSTVGPIPSCDGQTAQVFPYPGDCSKYYVCIHVLYWWQLTYEQCPDGTGFSSTLLQCTTDVSPTTCETIPSTSTVISTTTTTSTPEPNVTPDCSFGAAKFAIPGNCSEYYECVKILYWYQLTIRTCASGSGFSAATLQCTANISPDTCETTVKAQNLSN